MLALTRFISLLGLFIYGFFRALLFPSSDLISRLSKRMLDIFDIEVVCEQPFEPHGKFVFPNHQGWIDGPVLAALMPARFISKYEMKETPFLGWLMGRLGCLFVKRGLALDYQPVLRDTVLDAARSTPVVVFPEGTTSRTPTKLKMGFISLAAEKNVYSVAVTLNFVPQEPILFVGKEPLYMSVLRMLRHKGKIKCVVTWDSLPFWEGKNAIAKKISEFWKKEFNVSV